MGTSRLYVCAELCDWTDPRAVGKCQFDGLHAPEGAAQSGADDNTGSRHSSLNGFLRLQRRSPSGWRGGPAQPEAFHL